MEDRQIVELYWQKNADAISETSSKYGAYCFTIADHILNNAEDSEECVNDTWLHAWNAMPPQRPNALRMFLARITRNLSVNRFNARSAEKRGGGEIILVLDELADCLAAGRMRRRSMRPGSWRNVSGASSGACRSGTEMCSCAGTSSQSRWPLSPGGTA